MGRMPYLTFGLMGLMMALFALPASWQGVLQLQTDVGSTVEGLRLLSGHFVHADVEHLLWNLLAFGVLGSIVERHSMALLWTSLAVGILFVNALLLSPLSDIDYYCGLSGALNTLLGVALWVLWKDTRHQWLIAAVACASVVKVVIELASAEALLTHISWPPYPLSHLAGLVAAPVVIFIFYKQTNKAREAVTSPASVSAEG